MTSETANSPVEGQTQAFQADVARLLQLMVHSVYSDRDVFLRELISNAADACEKLRFEALANPAILQHAEGQRIDISIDKDGGELLIADNGIGMNREELTEALGTIANSGTRAFLEKVNASKQADDGELKSDEADAADTSTASGTNLIGQFGIGFYSAFMVADTVDVISRKAGEGVAWQWSSQGEGTFTIAESSIDEMPASGTKVILHMREDAKEFMEPHRIESIIREYSSAITIPVELTIDKEADPKKLTDGVALWTRSRNEIMEDEYKDFYREIARQFDDPDLTLHWRAEGRNEYTVVAFIPGSPPIDLFDPARKGRARLYVRRVLISDEADLLPGWLRFVRVVVDSADLPLNVSREIIQESPVFSAIKSAVTNRILQELGKLAKSDSEKFNKIWKNFGPVIKEGLYEDFQRRDQLYEVARFSTTHEDGEFRSLSDYVAGLRPNQTAIYYIAGDDAKRLAISPQIEGFRQRGIEVLILSDPVDSFWVSNASGFDGKPFKSATQGALDLKDIPVVDGKDSSSSDEVSTEVATFLARAKQVLEDEIEDVRTSDRLSDSPACIVAPDQAMDRRLEKLLAEHGRVDETSKPVLEINPSHALIQSLAAKVASAEDAALVDDAVWLLYDEARLIDGEHPSDMSAFANRLFGLMARALK